MKLSLSNLHMDKLNKYMLFIKKRLRFVLSVLIMAFCMLIGTFFYFDKAFFFIPILIIVTYALTYFSLLEGVEGFEWFSLFIMPVILTLAFYLVYFLFPGRWITRLLFIAIYGIGSYAILLCSNIFNVGVEKSLQLYRAAFSVNFFIQTIILFLLFNTMFSFHFDFLLNGIIIGVVAFLCSLQLFWTVKLNPHPDRAVWYISFLVGLILGQIGIIASFVPVKGAIAALFMTACYYSFCGLLYNYYDQRLFKETVREFLFVLGFASVLLLLSING